MTTEKTYYNFAQFQRDAMRTGAATRGDGALSLAGMGLAGEAGEVCDLAKKVVHHGRPLDDAMRTRLVEEAGDVLWYLAFLADTLGVTMEDMARANVAKLARRYPNGFNTADSIAKRDEMEGATVGDGHGYDANTGITHSTGEDR